MSILNTGAMMGCYKEVLFPCWEYAKGGLGSAYWTAMDEADQEECELRWVKLQEKVEEVGVSFIRPLLTTKEGYLAQRRIDVEKLLQYREHWEPQRNAWVGAGSTNIRRIYKTR